MIKKIGLVRNKLYNGIGIFFAIYLGYTILSVLCISPDVLARFPRAYKYSCLLPVIGVIIILALLRRFSGNRVLDKLEEVSDRRFYLCLIIVSVIVLAVQIICMFFISKPLASDFGTVRETAISLGTDNRFINDEYFSRYENNQGILFIYAIIVKITHHWKAVVACGILLVNLSVLMTAQITYKITGRKIHGVLIFIVGILLYDFAQRAFVPYTDSWGVFFLILPLCIYVNLIKHRDKGTRWWWAACAASLGVAVFIKTTGAILLIAAVIAICLLVRRRQSGKIKQAVSKLVIFAAVFVVSFGALGMCKNAYFAQAGFQEDEELRFGLSHYFMKGQNDDTLGTNSVDDVEYSAGIATAEERKETEISVGLERIKNRGIKGNLKFYNYKNFQNYHDGCFSVILIPSDDYAVGDSIFEKIFIEDGQYFTYYAFVEQTLWLLVLTLIMIGAVHRVTRLKGAKDMRSRFVFFLQLTVLGVSAYALIFESRAKYLFMFLPIYFLLAGDGLHLWMKEGFGKVSQMDCLGSVK